MPFRMLSEPSARSMSPSACSLLMRVFPLSTFEISGSDLPPPINLSARERGKIFFSQCHRPPAELPPLIFYESYTAIFTTMFPQADDGRTTRLVEIRGLRGDFFTMEVAAKIAKAFQGCASVGARPPRRPPDPICIDASLLVFLLELLTRYQVHQPYQSYGRRFAPQNINIDGGSQAGVCSLAVQPQGYNCQEFEVKTDDGYILSVQRIPQGRVGGKRTKRPPVLLQHGVLVDGMQWLLNSPEQSLAYILADNGYDVWVSNTRGTKFSRRHVTLDPTTKEYWNWSWDDLVTHDLPTIINLIFQQTGQKIHYVGHSLGTLMAMASFSEGLEVDKVKSAVLLSPIAYLSHMNTKIGNVLARGFVGELTTFFGLAEFNPKSPAVGRLLKTLCDQPGMDCYNIMAAITGKNCCLNASTVDIFLKHEPQPTSTKNMVHLAQTVRDGRLRKYDYGRNYINLEHYGEDIPPAYDLSKIPHDFPMFLSYGGQDALSDVKDVATLLDLLKGHDLDKLQVQYVKDYAHADFIIGVNAKDVVYNHVIKFFNDFH